MVEKGPDPRKVWFQSWYNPFPPPNSSYRIIIDGINSKTLHSLLIFMFNKFSILKCKKNSEIEAPMNKPVLGIWKLNIF